MRAIQAEGTKLSLRYCILPQLLARNGLPGIDSEHKEGIFGPQNKRLKDSQCSVDINQSLSVMRFNKHSRNINADWPNYLENIVTNGGQEQYFSSSCYYTEPVIAKSKETKWRTIAHLLGLTKTAFSNVYKINPIPDDSIFSAQSGRKSAIFDPSDRLKDWFRFCYRRSPKKKLLKHIRKHLLKELNLDEDNIDKKFELLMTSIELLLDSLFSHKNQKLLLEVNHPSDAVAIIEDFISNDNYGDWDLLERNKY